MLGEGGNGDIKTMLYTQTINTIRTALVDIFDELDTWFDKPVDVRAFKPAPDEWSIDENLEHITLTSHFLLKVIRKGVDRSLKRATNHKIEGTESDLERMTDVGIADSFVWHRPEHMIPTGAKPMNDVRQLMREQQTECLILLQKMPDGEGSLYKVRMSVNNLGKIDTYQWLYFLALHAKRHITQIERTYQQWQSLSQ
jgi:hypothetical protein